jgi:hypothetical protein
VNLAVERDSAIFDRRCSWMQRPADWLQISQISQFGERLLLPRAVTRGAAADSLLSARSICNRAGSWRACCPVRCESTSTGRTP